MLLVLLLYRRDDVWPVVTFRCSQGEFRKESARRFPQTLRPNTVWCYQSTTLNCRPSRGRRITPLGAVGNAHRRNRSLDDAHLKEWPALVGIRLVQC